MRRAAPAPVAALAAEPSWVMAAPSSLGLDGTVSVSVGIVGSFGPAATHRSRAWALGSRGTDRKPIDTGRPFLPEGSRREVPYRAGEPARNWHLAGVAAGRLSWLQRAGPSATLHKAIQLPTMVRAGAAPCQPMARGSQWPLPAPWPWPGFHGPTANRRPSLNRGQEFIERVLGHGSGGHEGTLRP